MEPLLGFFTFFGVALGVGIYKRWFESTAAAHAPFDAWVKTQPLVAAFRAPTGRSNDLSHVVREALGDTDYSNRHGRYPWQHYFVRFEHRRLSDDVVGLVVVGAVVEKSHESRPDFQVVLERLAKSNGGLIEEAWLHGQLFSRDGRPGKDRDRVGWSSGPATDAFDFREMIGQPAWVPAPAARAA